MLLASAETDKKKHREDEEEEETDFIFIEFLSSSSSNYYGLVPFHSSAPARSAQDGAQPPPSEENINKIKFGFFFEKREKMKGRHF